MIPKVVKKKSRVSSFPLSSTGTLRTTLNSRSMRLSSNVKRWIMIHHMLESPHLKFFQTTPGSVIPFSQKRVRIIWNGKQHSKKEEEESRQYWTNESQNIHQEMYDLATKNGKTTVQLNPVGGSETFQEGPGGWMSGTGYQGQGLTDR